MPRRGAARLRPISAQSILHQPPVALGGVRAALRPLHRVLATSRRLSPRPVSFTLSLFHFLFFLS